MDIQIDSADFVKYYKAVRTIDEKIVKEMRKNLRDSVKPIVEEVRRAALALPSKGGDAVKGARGQGQLGLRQGIAAATQMKSNLAQKDGAQIRIRISGTVFADKTGKYRKLPRYVEGLGKRPWRHPVFAEKGSTGGTWQGYWASQASTPFLLKTVFPHKPEIRQAAHKAIIEGLRKAKLEY